MRRIRSLLAGLPHDSLVVGLENPAAASYSLTNELLAALIEVVDGTSLRTAAVTAGVAGAKWKPPKPITVPRPWDQSTRPKVRRKPTADETQRLLNAGMRGGE